jgi:hypothetical protein
LKREAVQAAEDNQQIAEDGPAPKKKRKKVLSDASRAAAADAPANHAAGQPADHVASKAADTPEQRWDGLGLTSEIHASTSYACITLHSGLL